MKLETHDAKKKIIGQVRHGNLMDLEKDNDGQLIVYTGLFVHSDGLIYDCVEEKIK